MDLSQRVPLRPELNFRDIGGYETSDGRRVRTGLVYRSAHLHGLDEADLEGLRRLEIRTVCDLRHAEEAAVRPGPFTDDPAVNVLSLGMIGTRATGDPVTTIVEYGITSITDADIAAIYQRFADEHTEVYRRVVETCSDPEAHPVVVHCSAGKDRTGLAAALMLTVLGVPESAVLDDYELTNQLWTPAQFERARRMLPDHGVDPEPLAAYFQAPRPAMAATLAYLRERDGSIEGYLVDRCGVAATSVDRLREVLLDDHLR